jgi:hypothetical protein
MGDAKLGRSTPNAAPKHAPKQAPLHARQPEQFRTPGRRAWVGIGLAVALILLALHAGFAVALYKTVAALRLSPTLFAAFGVLASILVLVHLRGARLIRAWVGARQNRVKGD